MVKFDVMGPSVCGKVRRAKTCSTKPGAGYATAFPSTYLTPPANKELDIVVYMIHFVIRNQNFKFVQKIQKHKPPYSY